MPSRNRSPHRQSGWPLAGAQWKRLKLLFEPELATYRKVPAESMASKRRRGAHVTVRGVTSVSAPALEIVKQRDVALAGVRRVQELL